jgi:hypothetical protein
MPPKTEIAAERCGRRRTRAADRDRGAGDGRQESRCGSTVDGQIQLRIVTPFSKVSRPVGDYPVTEPFQSEKYITCMVLILF